MFLENRPTSGEILLSALFDTMVFEEYLINDSFLLVVEKGVLRTLARLKELGFDCWSLETISIPLVDGRCIYPVPANVMALFDARICGGSDPAEAGKLLFPITQAEYENIPDKLLCGTPTVFTFDGLSGAELALWPVPQGSGIANAISCNALTWVRVPEGRLFGLEGWFNALGAGLAYNIGRRWPVSCVPLNYLERESEDAYRRASLVEE